MQSPARFWQRLRGWYSFYHRRKRQSFRPPMNGQTERIKLVQEVITQCGIERIVETGTFLANTTVWFASYGLPVMTVEINPRHFGFSRARLRRHRNAVAHEGNSIDFLRSIIAGPINPRAPTLFYLDAHWLDHLPLRDEVELITTNFSRSVIVIDDFEVPDDPAMGATITGPASGCRSITCCRLERHPWPSIFLASVRSRRLAHGAVQ